MTMLLTLPPNKGQHAQKVRRSRRPGGARVRQASGESDSWRHPRYGGEAARDGRFRDVCDSAAGGVGDGLAGGPVGRPAAARVGGGLQMAPNGQNERKSALFRNFADLVVVPPNPKYVGTFWGSESAKSAISDQNAQKS